MKAARIAIIAISTALASAAAPPPGGLAGQLLRVEREFWQAWKNGQPQRFARAMADDGVFFGLYGVSPKAELVAEQHASIRNCRVTSYRLSGARAIRVAPEAAILLYDAEQHAVCGGTAVQPYMHGESVYALRHGHWICVLRSEVPAADRH